MPEVSPPFLKTRSKPAHQPPASRALSRPRGARRPGQLATATDSSPLRSPRYGSQEEHKPLQGRVAERAIAHQMARSVWMSARFCSRRWRADLGNLRDRRAERAVIAGLLLRGSGLVLGLVGWLSRGLYWRG